MLCLRTLTRQYSFILWNNIMSYVIYFWEIEMIIDIFFIPIIISLLMLKIILIFIFYNASDISCQLTIFVVDFFVLIVLRMKCFEHFKFRSTDEKFFFHFFDVLKLLILVIPPLGAGIDTILFIVFFVILICLIEYYCTFYKN